MLGLGCVMLRLGMAALDQFCNMETGKPDLAEKWRVRIAKLLRLQVAEEMLSQSEALEIVLEGGFRVPNQLRRQASCWFAFFAASWLVWKFTGDIIVAPWISK